MQTSSSFEILVLSSRARAFPAIGVHCCLLLSAAPYGRVVPPPYDSLWRDLQRGDSYHLHIIRIFHYHLLDEDYACVDHLFREYGFHSVWGAVRHASDASPLVGKMRVPRVLSDLERGLHFDAREPPDEDVHAKGLHDGMRTRSVFRPLQ
jgi:hypothetical protein